MNRDIVRKTVLVLFGLLFMAAIYPIMTYLRQPGDTPPGDTMMMSLYLALGVFLLLAAKNPATHRSLILYAGWANITHGAVMFVMAFRIPKEQHGFLVASAAAVVIGLCLIAATPPKTSRDAAASQPPR